MGNSLKIRWIEVEEMKLKGKVAVITGGGRGLGKASAMEMAKEGASVVILSRTLSELKVTAKAIKEIGGEVIFLKADVSKPRDIKRVVDQAISRYGKIDILMNNAAVIGPVKPLFKVREREWNEIFHINLRGAFLFSKWVIPHMIEQRKGKIVNVISGLGEIVMPPFGPYSITKAGLIHLTRLLAEELKDFRIQVNGLDPGVMDTGMQEEIRELGSGILGDKMYREFLRWKERGELKAPEKVARLALFLASEQSDAITGKTGTETHYRRFGYRG